MNGPLFYPATLTLSANNTYTGVTFVVNHAIVAVPQITNGGVASPIGASTAAAGNLLLGRVGNGRGDLLLTGIGASYSTDRAATVEGDGGAREERAWDDSGVSARHCVTCRASAATCGAEKQTGPPGTGTGT